MAKPAVRLRVVQVAFGISIVAVLGRAAEVQLVRGAKYAEMARSQRTERVVLPARRGAIFDRNGVPLASTQESYHVGIAPNELRDSRQDVRVIASSLGLSRHEVERALRKKYAYFHGPFSSARVDPLRKIRGVH